MENRKIVERAIEFETPPRIPFLQRELPDLLEELSPDAVVALGLEAR